MVKEQVKKVLKLNDFDRRVLLVYADILRETGAKLTTEATEIKMIHKNSAVKA